MTDEHPKESTFKVTTKHLKIDPAEDEIRMKKAFDILFEAIIKKRRVKSLTG